MHFYIFKWQIVSIPFVIISYKNWGIIININVLNICEAMTIKKAKTQKSKLIKIQVKTGEK